MSVAMIRIWRFWLDEGQMSVDVSRDVAVQNVDVRKVSVKIVERRVQL